MMNKMTPDLHDEKVQKLLRKINSKFQPIYLSVTAEPYALINECFPNVEKKISKDGGGIVYGWQIWKSDLICEAEFHAVWRSSNGDLVDITPKSISIDRILFVQDDKINYNGAQVENIRINCTNNLLVNDFIDIQKALFRIMNKGERALSYEIHFSQQEQGVYDELYKMNFQIQQYVRQGGQLVYPCFCGSGYIYSECHSKKLNSLLLLSKSL